jgi:cytochrome c-type biogenesis protein CcmF
VGLPYFNRTFVPLMVPVLIAVAAGPLLAWKRGDLAGALQRLWVAFAAVVAVVLVGLYVTRGGPVLAVLGFGLAAWVFLGALAEWAERVKLFQAHWRDSWRRARGLPRAAHGMTLAHLGLAVSVAGIAASAFETERIEVLHPGNSVPVAAYVLRLDGVDEVAGPDYTADRAVITAKRDGVTVAVMHPEKRFFPVQQVQTSLTAIHTNLLADLYVALGDGDGQGGWTVRAYWKPLVPWIWIGAVVMALGGLTSLSDRRRRVGAAARRAACGGVNAQGQLGD